MRLSPIAACALSTCAFVVLCCAHTGCFQICSCLYVSSLRLLGRLPSHASVHWRLAWAFTRCQTCGSAWLRDCSNLQVSHGRSLVLDVACRVGEKGIDALDTPQDKLKGLEDITGAGEAAGTSFCTASARRCIPPPLSKAPTG